MRLGSLLSYWVKCKVTTLYIFIVKKFGIEKLCYILGTGLDFLVIHFFYVLICFYILLFKFIYINEFQTSFLFYCQEAHQVIHDNVYSH